MTVYLYPGELVQESFFQSPDITSRTGRAIYIGANPAELMQGPAHRAIVIEPQPGPGIRPDTRRVLFQPYLVRCYGRSMMEADHLSLAVQAWCESHWRQGMSRGLLHDMSVVGVLPGQRDPDTKWHVSFVTIEAQISRDDYVYTNPNPAYVDLTVNEWPYNQATTFTWTQLTGTTARFVNDGTTELWFYCEGGAGHSAAIRLSDDYVGRGTGNVISIPTNTTMLPIVRRAGPFDKAAFGQPTDFYKVYVFAGGESGGNIYVAPVRKRR